MNFEVFATEFELNNRVRELQKDGVTNIITNFNGFAWTLKWRS